MTNILRHAQAKQIVMQLRDELHEQDEKNRQDDRQAITLAVHDDGIGFDMAQIDGNPKRGIGLRARLEAVAHFDIVAEPGSAEEALQSVAQHPIDLILMDIELRGSINVIDLTARFHVDFPEIAVLILSMHDKTEYLMQSVQAGARGYVLKDAPGKDIVISGGIYYSAALAQKLMRPMTPGQLLTARERQVLQDIANGESNKQIAPDLALSMRTVEAHRLNIKRKLDIAGQAELIKFVVENNFR